MHYSYGEELGLTSDDDDYVAPLEDKGECIVEQCVVVNGDDKAHGHNKDIEEEDEVDNYKPVCIHL